MHLTKFSLRRGAPVTPETLALYTEDLSTFELDDIASALDKFGQAVPEKFESPFPCVGVFLEKVQSVAYRRKQEERKAKERLEEQEKQRLYEADRAANPEKYVALEREFQEDIARMNKRFGFAAAQPKPTPAPAMTACPHCEKNLPLAAGIRMMTGAEVIEMGQMMVELEAQRAERSEANRLHADKCIQVEMEKANLDT